MPSRDEQLINIAWDKGKDEVSHETNLGAGFLREALNVDINRTGAISRRQGFSQVHTGSDIHSLVETMWGLLFMEGTTLKLMDAAEAVTVVSTGLSGKPLSYCQVNTQVVISDQTKLYTYDGTTLSLYTINKPYSPIVLSSSGGGLYPGRYIIGVCYEDSTGKLSPGVVKDAVDVAEGGKIVVTIVGDQPTNISYIRIYCSSPNGSMLFLQDKIPYGSTSYTIYTATNAGPILENENTVPMPAGSIIREFKGRLYSSIENALFWSDPLNYGVCKLHTNYIQFPSTIKVVEPAIDGLYVVADRTYFLTGSDPKQFTQTVAYPYGALANTSVTVPSSLFSFDVAADYLSVWFSDTGLVIGLPGGQIKPIMEDIFAVSEYSDGATLFKEKEGLRQIITSVTGRGDTNSFGISDMATAEIRRNGVTLT